MNEQIHEHRVKNIDKISKMAIAHTNKNAQTMQKLSQMRTEINGKKTHLQRAEQTKYVQELVDCYQMDSDPITFKRKLGLMAIRETMGVGERRKTKTSEWVEWNPPQTVHRHELEEEDELLDMSKLVHSMGE